MTTRDFDYEDIDGDNLHIGRSPHAEGDHGPLVYVSTEDGGAYVKTSDAPQVALALLEIAGFDEAVGTGRHIGMAVSQLRTHVREEEAERERKAAEEALQKVEDEKVQAFRRVILEAQGFTLSTIVSWEEASDDYREGWRKQYRAVDALFAPTELQHGAPEPDHDTQWTNDSIEQISGNPAPLHYDKVRRGWTWGTCAATMSWVNLGKHMFPLTKVAE
jgi:hypothetical protein